MTKSMLHVRPLQMNFHKNFHKANRDQGHSLMLVMGLERQLGTASVRF
jgi:hypothetical protein